MSTAADLTAEVTATLDKFKVMIPGAAELCSEAKGILVFPSVFKAGLGVGYEYGEGALLRDKLPNDYFNFVAATVGLQVGISTKTMIFAFMDDQTLNDFRYSEGWDFGISGGLTILNLAAGEEINIAKLTTPVVGFVLDSQGVMVDMSLKGSKISRIQKF